VELEVVGSFGIFRSGHPGTSDQSNLDKKERKVEPPQPALVVCSNGLSLFPNSIKGRQYSIDERTLCGHQ